MTPEELQMNHHANPHNSNVKPSLDSLEGKIYLVVSLLTAVSAALGTVLAAYPDNPHVKVAALVIAALMAFASAFAANRFGEQRSQVKQTANVVAGTLAVIDKAKDVAKDHPELAAAILGSAGIGASLPKPPAST